MIRESIIKFPALVNPKLSNITGNTIGHTPVNPRTRKNMTPCAIPLYLGASNSVGQ